MHIWQSNQNRENTKRKKEKQDIKNVYVRTQQLLLVYDKKMAKKSRKRQGNDQRKPQIMKAFNLISNKWTVKNQLGKNLLEWKQNEMK
jgi:hypothetical protein